MEKNRIGTFIHKRKRKSQMKKVIWVVVPVVLFLILGLLLQKPEDAYKMEVVHLDHAKVEEEKQNRTDALLENLEAEGAPEGILSTLRKNSETRYFAEDYIDDHEEVSVSTKISPENTTIPYFLQWDEKWGYEAYGNSTISSAGCGPTCLAMVISYFTKDETITPSSMARYSTENEFLTEDGATYCALMETAGDWDVRVEAKEPDEEIVAEALKAGNPVICNVFPGDFTEVGHFIVLTGYVDGMVAVNDPFSYKNSLKLWRYADIQDQIDMIWVYSK